MRRPIWGTVACATFLFAAPAFGATQRARGDCEQESDRDREIAACTRILGDYSESRHNRAVAYDNRGLAWRAKGDDDRAIADLSEAIRLDPKFAFAYYNRGLVREAKGDHDRAVADLSEAIRLDPKFAFAYYNRGLAREARGDHDRAVADLSEAIRLDPKYAPAYYNRSVAWSAKGDHDHAVADLTEAIRLDPKDADAYYDRGVAWRAKGDNDRAIADLTEAIRLDPKHVQAYGKRGVAYFSVGDFAAAAADLLRANDLGENAYPMLWRFLARSRLGQDGGAELDADAARLKTKGWPYPVIEFYLGRRTLAEMRAAAATSEQKCEAEFYKGEWSVLRGDNADAAAALQIAADSCPKAFSEHAGAIAELKRLKP